MGFQLPNPPNSGGGAIASQGGNWPVTGSGAGGQGGDGIVIVISYL